VGPVTPEIPVGPVGPVAPVAPEAPVTPATPTIPRVVRTQEGSTVPPYLQVIFLGVLEILTATARTMISSVTRIGMSAAMTQLVS
jgi:hypothetical protein